MRHTQPTTPRWKQAFVAGLAFGAGLCTSGLVAAAAAMNLFSPGEVISSTKINENFAMAAPEGAVVAFHLSACPLGWAAADGTNGTPDLRGRFVRGLNDFGTGAGTVSVDPAGLRSLGGLQLDAFQGHRIGLSTMQKLSGAISGADNAGGYQTASFHNDTSPYPSPAIIVSDGTNGNPRTSSETRPVNVALIFCMRKN